MLYQINPQIGTTKHSISFWDGVKTHKDRSPFYELRIFKTKRDKQKFEQNLIKQGYATR